MGLCYENGFHGLAQDLSKAAELYRRSAELGDAAAQSNLGSLYYTGSGVERDDALAFSVVFPLRRAGFSRRRLSSGRLLCVRTWDRHGHSPGG
ncbi:MAG: tetratricopeptide repeat protein [Intestinimonas sp.]